MTTAALQHPWVAVIQYDHHPHGRSWLVTGATEEEVRAQIPIPRSGPNGPIDCAAWLRAGGERVNWVPAFRYVPYGTGDSK